MRDSNFHPRPTAHDTGKAAPTEYSSLVKLMTGGEPCTEDAFVKLMNGGKACPMSHVCDSNFAAYYYNDSIKL